MELFVLLHLIILLSGSDTQISLPWGRALSDDSQHLHPYQAHSPETDCASLRPLPSLRGSEHVTSSRYVDSLFRNSTRSCFVSGETRTPRASDDQPHLYGLPGGIQASGLCGFCHSQPHTDTFFTSWHLAVPQTTMDKEDGTGSSGDAENASNLNPEVTAKDIVAESKTPLGTLLKKLGSRVKEDSQDVFLLQLLEYSSPELSSRHSTIVMNTLKQFGVEATEDLRLLTPAYLREYVERQNSSSFQHDISPMQLVITETFLRDHLELPSFRKPTEATSSVAFVQSEGPYKRLAPSRRRSSRGDSLSRNERASIGSQASTASTARPLEHRSTRRVHSDRRSNILRPSDFENVSGWEYAAEHANLDTHDKDSLTKEGKELQKDYRKKVAINAIKQLPDFDGNTSSWKDWSSLFTDYMDQVGYGIVCHKDFRTIAEEANWDTIQMNEASTYVWNQLRAAMFTHKSAMNQLVLSGPSKDGYTCWQGLVSKHGILGHARAEELRYELEKFSPKSGESPIDAVDRLAITYHDYEELDGVQAVLADDKARKLLSVVENWEDLDHIVKSIKREMVLKMEEKSFDDLCAEVRAYWASFGNGSSSVKTKMHAMQMRQDQSKIVEGLKDEIKTLRDETNGLKSTIYTMTGAALPSRGGKSQSNPKAGKSQTPNQSDDIPIVKTCKATSCSTTFTGKPWMVLCEPCFTAAKESRQPVPLEGGPPHTLTVVEKPARNGRKPGIRVQLDAVTIRMQSIVDLADPLDDVFCQEVLPNITRGEYLQDKQPQISSRIAASVAKYQPPTAPPIYVVADSGGGGSASGETSVFHEHGFPVQAEIEGYASGEDSLVKASFASVMQLLVHDRRTLQPLVLKAGGTLECKSGSTTATVLSGGQCSNHWLDTDGTEGAQMDTRNHRTCHLMLPDGHEVQIYQRNGQFGFDAWPVDPTSDVYHSAKHIWVAKDEIYRPPDECEVAPDVTPDLQGQDASHVSHRHGHRPSLLQR